MGSSRIGFATPRSPGRIAAGVGWASAGALYVGAFVAAELSSGNVDTGTAVLWAFAHSLPDLAASPLVLAAAARRVDRPVAAVRITLAAIAFLAVSVGGFLLAATALQAQEQGTWAFRLSTSMVAWKLFLSTLVLALLAGLGRARLFAREARDASERALRAEALRAEARLAALRARVEPHFVLNVLHSVVGLIERDPDAATAALERLGGTLRYAQRVTEADGDRVALRDEVDFTREYLDLERLRLGGRLTTRFEVPPALMGCGVPPFVLQPLAENAVVHAIAPRARGGLIEIRVEAEANALHISVDDDGDWRGEVETPAGAGARAGPGGGRGLALLRERLRALHGDGAALSLGRSPLGGLRVLVSLPAPAAGDGGEA